MTDNIVDSNSVTSNFFEQAENNSSATLPSSTPGVELSNAEVAQHSDHQSAPGPHQSEASANLPQPSDSFEPWMMAEGLPGIGEKPEWLSAKFKNVSEQAKAYREAEKRLGGFTGAPESYDTSIFENNPNWNFDSSDPLYQSFAEHAKQSNMSQEVFQKFVGDYIDNQVANVRSPEQEMEILGPNAQDTINKVSTWINNNFSPEEAEKIKGMASSAENVMLLDVVRNLSRDTGIANEKETRANQNRITEQTLQNYVQDPRYNEDPAFRAKVDRMFDEHFGN